MFTVVISHLSLPCRLLQLMIIRPRDLTSCPSCVVTSLQCYIKIMIIGGWVNFRTDNKDTSLLLMLSQVSKYWNNKFLGTKFPALLVMFLYLWQCFVGATQIDHQCRQNYGLEFVGKDNNYFPTHSWNEWNFKCLPKHFISDLWI